MERYALVHRLKWLAKGIELLKILYYGLNFSPELTGIGKYSGEMAKWFSGKGYAVYAVSTPPYYPEWKVARGYNRYLYSKSYEDGVFIVRCPLYVPASPTTVKRLIHLISFSLSSIPALVGGFFKLPDVVFIVQPTSFCAPIGLLFSKLTGAKAIMHIQDFELDAMFGLGMMKGGVIGSIARKLEGWLLRRFDGVSTISLSMMENAVRKGVPRNRLIFFPNWADTGFVTPDVDGKNLRQAWGFSNTDKVVLYAGNIGKKQGLEMVLDAAESLGCISNVKFVFVGTGSHFNTLVELSSARGLDNVFFKPLQPWGLVPQMLAMADVHLVVQKKGAADVVLPSKLTNILSAGGHALVTAESNTELGMIAERFPGIYERVEPEDCALFVQALRSMLEKDLKKVNVVAREYAVEYLSREKVLGRFERDLNTLCGL